MKRLLYILILVQLMPLSATATISSRALGDSLTTYIGFSPVVPRVRVKNLRVAKTTISLQTNKTLSCVAFSPDELAALKRYVSLLVLGNENGRVTISSDGISLDELVTDRMRPRKSSALYHLPDAPALPYGERLWDAPAGLDNRNIALWASHGMYYNRDLNMWHWQRARLWTMVEDLYTYELVHKYLIPMLENAGAYVATPRFRAGQYVKKDGVWQYLGNRVAPEGAEVRSFDDDYHLTDLRRGPDSIACPHPAWMMAARYWLEECGYPDSIYNKNHYMNDYRDDLQSRGLWVNYLCGGSRSNPKQPGLGIQLDAAVAIHTDGYDAGNDTTYIGTLAIYTDHDDSGRKTLPTGESRIVCRDLADYVQTAVVEDMRRTFAPQWVRRELNNAAYAESRYPVVPSVLVELLSHKNFADIQLALRPQVQSTLARAVYKGIGRWICASASEVADFVPTPLAPAGLAAVPVFGETQDELKEWQISWHAVQDTLEPTAAADYFVLYVSEDGASYRPLARTKDNNYVLAAQPNRRYDVQVHACNRGGQSMPSATLSLRYVPQTEPILFINAFTRTYGPDWFCDSLRAGIVPGSYPVPDGVSYAYLGDMWNYLKQRDVKDNGWTDDDNCGWGMCHMDYVGHPLVGNPAAVLSTPDSTTYSVYDVRSNVLRTDSTFYSRIEIVLGEQRDSLYPDPLRLFIERQLAHGTELTIRGHFLGSGLNKTESLWAAQILGYRLMAPNATVPLDKRNAPDALRPADKCGRVLRRFADTALPCELIVEKPRSLIHIITD